MSKSPGRPPKAGGACSKCGPGAGHSTADCKFEGVCDFCKNKGHKAAVCRKKKSVAFAEDDEVSVRMVRVCSDVSPEDDRCSPPPNAPDQWIDEDADFISIRMIKAEEILKENFSSPPSYMRTPPRIRVRHSRRSQSTISAVSVLNRFETSRLHKYRWRRA